MANPTPLKISTTFETRDGTSATKDSRITNLLVEPKGDETHFLKRPGYALYDGAGWAVAPALGATLLPNGQIISFNGTIGSANNATVNGSFVSITFDPTATSSDAVLSNGNLTLSNKANTSSPALSKGPLYKSGSGKYYAEFKVNVVTFWQVFGIVNSSASLSAIMGLSDANSYALYNDTSNQWKIYHSGQIQAGASTIAAGNVFSVMMDLGAGTVMFWKNGVQLGTTVSGITGAWTFGGQVVDSNPNSLTANFGSTPFIYTPPAGYVGLAT